jgi:hypothetical protein
LDPGDVDLARREGGELGGGLVHDRHDEALERWRAPERGRECRVGREHPAAIRLVRDEAKRPVSHWVLVPRRTTQLGAGHRVEQMGREDGQISQHVGDRALHSAEAHNDCRVVRVIHKRDVGEVVQPRVPGRQVPRRRERPRHIARRRRRAIVPAHAGLEPKHEGLPVR